MGRGRGASRLASQLRDLAAILQRPQNGPGPGLWCAGRLSVGEGAVPPFGALISKPFLMGQNWRQSRDKEPNLRVG